MKTAGVIAAISLAAALAGCEQPQTVRAECEKPAAPAADPWQRSHDAVIKNLHDIPTYVCEKLMAHLEARFGKDIVSRMAFTSGRKSDAFEEPAKAERTFLFNLEWGYATVRPYTHGLRFEVKGFPDGVSYDSFIGLSSGGRVVSDYEFPPVKEWPERATVLPPQCARDWAKAAGFTYDVPGLGYDKDAQRLMYGFMDYGTRMVRRCLVRIRYLQVDAHTCRVHGMGETMVSPFAC